MKVFRPFKRDSRRSIFRLPGGQRTPQQCCLAKRQLIPFPAGTIAICGASADAGADPSWMSSLRCEILELKKMISRRLLIVFWIALTVPHARAESEIAVAIRYLQPKGVSH